MTAANAFLPGVPQAQCLKALTAAGGNEIESGKLLSPESSAALAVNAFGWFLDNPERLPPFPGLVELDWPATAVAIERQMRFPWSGGRHPWLDAAVETETALIGVESKRFEPFRDRKKAVLSDAYDRKVWGERMGPFERMRDDLRLNPEQFEYLDAGQLVKHAFGLVTEGARIGKAPILLYLFAEPSVRAGKAISEAVHQAHRQEIERFAASVNHAAVRFAACSYREWFETWTGPTAEHANALTAKFAP